YFVDLQGSCRRAGAGSSPGVDVGPYEHDSPPVTPVLHVRHDATGVGTGTSWADAFTDLNAAFATALVARGPVQEIWVASGTYRPAGAGGNRQASFAVLTNLGVYGGFSGTE